jgi:DNA-binding transcriptional ArsR family regulator
MHTLTTTVHKYKIEERRRQVASLIAQSMNEDQIAAELGVDQSTISRDISALKKLSEQFVCNLAKSNLAFCYIQCLEGVGEVKKKTWELFRSESLSIKDKLNAMKLIKECDESIFSLFRDGPSVMNIQLLESRIQNIESR